MEVKINCEFFARKYELPPPSTLRPRSKSSVAGSSDLRPDSLPQDFASEVGIFHGSELSICWRIMGSQNCVELAPLDLVAQRFPGKGCRISISSPIAIHPYCTSLSEKDKCFVLDFMTVDGSLFTVLAPINWLVDPEITANSSLLPEHNVYQAHTFNLITPKILKAIGPNLLIVSVEDGSLVRLDRSSPLSSPSSTMLKVQKPSFSLSAFPSLFLQSRDRIPGHPNLSADTVVSLEAINNSTLVTCSINNTLRVWSLLSNTLIQEIEASSMRPLRMRPSNYIAVKELVVAVMLPQEVRFYTFEPHSQMLEINGPTLDLESDLRTWFVTSFCLLESRKLIIALKQNFSSKLFMVDNGKWEQIAGHDLSQALDLPSDVSISAIQSLFLERSPATIKCAINQVAPKALQTFTSQGRDLSSRSAIAELFSKMKRENSHTELLRIETLCREIEVQASELLAVAPAMTTSSGMFFWSLRVSGASLLTINTFDEPKNDANPTILATAESLMGQVPPSTLAQVSVEMLSSDLVLDRVDKACSLLRSHLDQLRLNELGRGETNEIALEFRQYIQNYGTLNPDLLAPSSENTNVPLCTLGKSAVSSLVSNYATIQALHFQKLSALAVIALVEGWFSKVNDESLLKDSITCLRKFTLIGELGIEKLTLDCSSVPIELFGTVLARKLIASTDMIDVFCQTLPPFVSEFTHEDRAELDRILSFCEISAEVFLLKALAALACGEESTGVALARQTSLSRPWPKRLGERPRNQSAWFLGLAKYSQTVGSHKAALELAQYSESLSSALDPHSNELHELLFGLSVAAGDIPVAYKSLTRRFRDDSTSEADLPEKWIKQLLTAAARKGEEEARNLVISYPFVGLSNALQKALSNTPSFAAIPSYKLNYAWHVEREDFVGAAQIIYDYIHNKKNIEPVRKEELYTVCLNALITDKEESRWLFFGDRAVSCQEVDAEHRDLLEEMAMQI